MSYGQQVAIAYCLGLMALMGLGMWLDRKLRKRNRWLPKPRPDMRSSIEYSKPHMPKRER